MAQNAPEPSGGQIIHNASIRGINREIVVAVVNALKAAAPGALGRALPEQPRPNRSSFHLPDPSGAVVNPGPESG